MALGINSNLLAINAQRNLQKSNAPLQQAMQRLSSGLRINSAKDDAAGAAIATRMTRQVNGLAVAVRNANDGISFAQTAEGAMDEMINATQRVYELAVQAASNNTSADRSSLNTEVQELISELSRIVTQTRYNGEQILNQQRSIDVQVGAEVGETINVSTSNVSPTTMGVSTTYSSTLGGSDVTQSAMLSYESGGLAGAATLAGTDFGDAITTASSYQNNSQALINRINQYTGDTGVTAFGFGNSLVGASTAMAAEASAAGTTASVAAGYLTINGTQIGSFALGTAGAASASIANLQTAINDKAATSGVSAYTVDSTGVLTATITSDTRMVLGNTSGAAISVSMNPAVSGGSLVGTHNFAAGETNVGAGANGKVVFNAGLTTTSIAFDGTATGAAFGVGTAAAAVSLNTNSINNISVTDVGGANVAILAAKEALETLNSEKATLGAKLNRFESTVRNPENVRENISAARSRIQDADFAEETTKLTKSLILQQAGISILSQANQVQQNVLALLQ